MRVEIGFYIAITVISVLRASRSQLSQSPTTSGFTKSSVILVPGFGCSKICAKLTQADTRYDCIIQEKFTLIWLNFYLLKTNFKCFSDVIRLNNTGGKAKDPDNVMTRICGFGKTDNIEFISKTHNIPYFYGLVKFLVGIGYTKNKNLRGAPYDFRRSLLQLNENSLKFKKLIQHTYCQNDNKPVSLICHSYGCLTTLYFLNSQNQNWKDKYVKNFIFIAGPLTGAIKALQSVISGAVSKILPMPDPLLFRPIWREFPSSYALFPTKNYPDKILVTVESKNYTLDDMQDLFTALNFTQGYDMWSRYKNEHVWQAPGVNTYCIFAKGTQTPASLYYSEGDFGKKLTKAIYEDGDGTVLISSSEVCNNWKSQQQKEVILKVYEKYDHDTILFSRELYMYLKSIL